MILQQKLVSRPYNITVKKTDKVTNSLAVPGAAFNLSLAMEQYKRGTLVERVKGFYEQEGFETPDFNHMTKLEQMQELAKYRKLRKEKAELLSNIANQKHEAYVKESIQKQKRAEGNRSSDTGEGEPNANGKDGSNKQG